VQAALTYGQYSRGHRSVGLRTIFFSAPAHGRPSSYSASRSRLAPTNPSAPIPTARTSRLACRSPSKPACRRATRSPSRTSRSPRGATGACGVAADPQAAAAGTQLVSAVGDTISYSTLDNRRARPAASIPSSGRISPASRRRQVPAHIRGRALLSRDQQRSHRAGSRPGRLHHRLGRVAGAARQ